MPGWPWCAKYGKNTGMRPCGVLIQLVACCMFGCMFGMGRGAGVLAILAGGQLSFSVSQRRNAAVAERCCKLAAVGSARGRFCIRPLLGDLGGLCSSSESEVVLLPLRRVWASLAGSMDGTRTSDSWGRPGVGRTCMLLMLLPAAPSSICAEGERQGVGCLCREGGGSEAAPLRTLNW